MNPSRLPTYNGLPQPVQFINSLIYQLSQCTATPQEPPNTNPPRHPHHHPPQPAFPQSQLPKLKPLMLTLHCIFPNELLLALDLLDRGLVRPLVLEQSDSDNHSPLHSRSHELLPPGPLKEDIFFVTSASTLPSQPPTASSTPQDQQQPQWHQKGYEVRLKAWNCTCPSFTIAAFRDVGPEPDLLSEETEPEPEPEPEPEIEPVDLPHDYHGATGTTTYSFGGTLTLPQTRSAPPLCKHILACLLAVLCPGLGGWTGRGDETGGFSSVTGEELAGLCAGWGG